MSESTVILSVNVSADTKEKFNAAWEKILAIAKQKGMRKPIKGVWLEKILDRSDVLNMSPDEYLKTL